MNKTRGGVRRSTKNRSVTTLRARARLALGATINASAVALLALHAFGLA